MRLKREKKHFPHPFPWLILFFSLLPVSCIDWSMDSDDNYSGSYYNNEIPCDDPCAAPETPWTHSAQDNGDVTMDIPDENDESESSTNYFALFDYGNYVLFLKREESVNNIWDWDEVLWAINTETWNIRKIPLPEDVDAYESLYGHLTDSIKTFGNRSFEGNRPYEISTNVRPYEDKVLYWDGLQVALIPYESEQTLIEPTRHFCHSKRLVPFPNEPKLIATELEDWYTGAGTLSILNNGLKQIAQIPLEERLWETLGEEITNSLKSACSAIHYYRPFYLFWENDETFLFMFAYEKEHPDGYPTLVDPTFIRFSNDPFEPEAAFEAQGCPTFGTHIPQSSLALLHMYGEKTSIPSCLIDFETMEVIERYPATKQFEVTPDGKRLVMLPEDEDEENGSSRYRWISLDLESYQSEEIPTDTLLIPERFSPDSKRLLAYPKGGGGLVIYNLETNEWNSLGVSLIGSYWSFSSEENEMYIGGDAVGLKRFDLEHNTQEFVSIDVGSWLGNEVTIGDLKMVFGVNGGKYLLLGFKNTRSILVYDTETREVTTSFELR